MNRQFYVIVLTKPAAYYPPMEGGLALGLMERFVNRGFAESQVIARTEANDVEEFITLASMRDLYGDDPTAFALRRQPATLPRRATFTSTPATQRVLLAGLDCAPGQADLFSTDGTN